MAAAVDTALRGRDIIAALKEADIAYVAALPDLTTSEGLLWPLSRDPHFRLIRLCKEDEGVSICAGLGYTGVRAVLLMQMTGFFDSVNSIRAIGCEYGNPVCMMIGMLNKEPGVPPAQSKAFGVRIVEPILDAMEIPHICLEGPEDVARVPAAIDRAYTDSRPLAILFGKVIEP